ncbi:MAG TPA: SGNH/GDSL hydrolase family protein, partial [Planctomycetota bacterium]|nr:SGNH/GDSL hydrolase family protein [Planctomycetota bacterium]
VAGALSARDATRLDSDAEIETALRKLPTVGQMTWPNDEHLNASTEAGVKSMIENMDRLLGVLKARGIALTVVVYPWPDQVVAGDPDCRHVRTWREWCRKNGVRFVDAFPKFEVGSSWKRRAEILDTCYILGDAHFNTEGHRRIAEAILEAMPEASPPPK